MSAKLAFIDHSFHKKSKATKFLTDLLDKYYEVSIFWDESWSNKSDSCIERAIEEDFDIIVLFQNFFLTKKLLNKLKNRNLILIPMYDGVPHDSNLFWYPYRHFKLINFSKTLHERLTELGLSSFHVQYFPVPGSPESNNGDFSNLKGFFWQRRCEITWDQIRILIRNSNYTKFHIHYAIDPPGFKKILPTDEEINQYGITTSEWFPDNAEYMQLLFKSNVYFAPRPYEGIGMSFLEAMAIGKCVVAPNHPTMNEYITDGYNGYLYNLKNPLPIDFSTASQIAHNALKSIESGYEKWIESESELINFINQIKKNISGNHRQRTSDFKNYLKRRSTILNTLKQIISYHLRKYFPRFHYKLAHLKRGLMNYLHKK
jgi:hypothetical protein